MNVNELEGAELRRAVALACGYKVEKDGKHPAAEWIVWLPDEGPRSFSEYGWCPDAKWEHGGPLIERERITIIEGMGAEWAAFIGCEWSSGELESSRFSGFGPTPLIAAMRAFCASKQPSPSEAFTGLKNATVGPLNFDKVKLK